MTGHAKSRGEVGARDALYARRARKSRTEPGCLAHAVYQDAENPLRLIFLEEWADRESLAAHFTVPASREFVKTLQELTVSSSGIKIYDATSISL